MNLILAMGTWIVHNGTFYLYTVFILAYGVLPQIGFSKISLLNAISIAAISDMFSIPAYGWLSDKLGRRPVYMFGAIFTGLFAFPLFWMIETSSTVLMVLAIVIALALGHAAMYGPQARSS